MVNQADQPDSTQSAPPTDGGGITTDVTSEFEGVNTFDDFQPSTEEATTEPVATEDTPPETTEPVPSAEVVPDTATPPIDTGELPSLEPQDDIRRRMEQLEQQNQQFYLNQQESQLNQQYEKYKADLENAGYLPDQAEHVANNWRSSANEQAVVQRQQQEIAQYIQGQQAAAEHFADKYKLGLSDLRELRQHQTPESMESAAKRISSDREKDAEIAKLRAQLVPSQSFEDNQSTPAASNSEDRWLERYNQGDRSPEAQSAARRAAGLG